LKTKELAQAAKKASRRLALLTAAEKNRALIEMAEALERRSAEILVENAKDVTDGRKKGLSPALIDRLLLDEERLRGIARSLRDIAALPDPVGEIVAGWRTAEGLEIQRVRVPFGVIAVVYEARPNGTRSSCGAVAMRTGPIASWPRSSPERPWRQGSRASRSSSWPTRTGLPSSTCCR
jgi:glutamate-5-semialdehyde dehydrogenase